MTAAALGLLVGACTIEDASDKRAADSAAAATAVGTQQTPSSAGSVAGQTAPLPGQADAATTTGMTGDTSAASGTPGDSARAAATAGTAGATGAMGTGNLSPDSVDVGRRSKADMLPLSTARIEVDLGAKQLYLYDNDQRVASYRVAVGSTEWPTQAGQWNVFQVVWNPEWIPPDESWAEEKTPRKSGAPDNPLGRAQLIYDPPRTIHGTNDPSSIGKAVSHGSIRLANADAVRLARQLMEITGVNKDAAWYRQVQQNSTKKVVVDLPKRVPIKIS